MNQQLCLCRNKDIHVYATIVSDFGVCVSLFFHLSFLYRLFLFFLFWWINIYSHALVGETWRYLKTVSMSIVYKIYCVLSYLCIPGYPLCVFSPHQGQGYYATVHYMDHTLTHNISHKLHFKGSGHLVPLIYSPGFPCGSSNGKSPVHGVLWQIPPSCFHALDQ